MPSLPLLRSSLSAAAALFLTFPLHADLPVPDEVLDPQNPAEAWNVIRLATENTARLLREERLPELPGQVILCSPALRTLAGFALPQNKKQVDQLTAQAFGLVNNTAQSAKLGLQPNAEASFERLRAALDELAPLYDPADVAAEIYVCPRHPEVLATTPETPCRHCANRLRVRRLPYTELYVIPDPNHVPAKLRLEPGALYELTAGSVAPLRLRLESADDTPLPASRLLPLHGEPFRLLLVDQTLRDFHLLTPADLDAPGTFESSFTPALPGPYRLWAEFAPEETALPEHPSLDLGGEFTVVDRSRNDVFRNATTVTAGGFTFTLTFTGGNAGFPPPRQHSLIRLKITDASGEPVTRLEPFMNAFAHITGIFEDGETLLRLHPVGGDVLRDDLRGGPWLAFQIYTPRAGFLRLFCQVKIDGEVITVPLGVQIRE